MKNLNLTLLLSTVAIGLLAGCPPHESNGNGGGFFPGHTGTEDLTANPISCTTNDPRGFVYCAELSTKGMSQPQIQEIENSCTQTPQSAVSYAVCTKENLVGTCVIMKNATAIKIRFYAPVLANTVKQSCAEQHGIFQN